MAALSAIQLFILDLYIRAIVAAIGAGLLSNRRARGLQALEAGQWVISATCLRAPQAVRAILILRNSFLFPARLERKGVPVPHVDQHHGLRPFLFRHKPNAAHALIVARTRETFTLPYPRFCQYIKSRQSCRAIRGGSIPYFCSAWMSIIGSGNILSCRREQCL